MLNTELVQLFFYSIANGFGISKAESDIPSFKKGLQFDTCWLAVSVVNVLTPKQLRFSKATH